MEKTDNNSFREFLNKIGVYGMDNYEDIIMVPLVTESPVILIGSHGTGKTYLLNNLAKMVGMKHKHYNASLISFEDLIGYPFPDKENKKVEFLKTEASVWDANSILIDEINRCKPETQNKFFSLIHEKKLEGIELKNLIYRWAAMNPPGYIDDENNSQDYEGVNYLDKALADRFSLFIETPKWFEIDYENKKRIVSSNNFEEIDKDEGFITNLLLLKKEFKNLLNYENNDILKYSIFVADYLNKKGIELSPRRVKMIYQNLVALSVIKGDKDFLLFYEVLRLSLPHKCFGINIDNIDGLMAIHEKGFNQYIKNKMDPFYKFLFVNEFIEKTEALVNGIKNPEERGLALSNFIRDNKINTIYKEAYLYTIFPALITGKINVNFQILEEILSKINVFYKQALNLTMDDDDSLFIGIGEINSKYLKHVIYILSNTKNSFKMQNFIKFFFFKLMIDNDDINITQKEISFLINQMRNFYGKYYLGQKEEL